MRLLASSCPTRGQVSDQRLLRAPLDGERVALLDDHEAFARLVAEDLLRLAHHVFDRDEAAGHAPGSDERGEGGDDHLFPSARSGCEVREGDIDEPRQHNTDRDYDQLVEQRRQRVRAHQGAGGYRQGVDEPEAEDRLDGQRPIRKAGSLDTVCGAGRDCEHWDGSNHAITAPAIAACPLAEP